MMEPEDIRRCRAEFNAPLQRSGKKWEFLYELGAILVLSILLLCLGGEIKIIVDGVLHDRAISAELNGGE